MLYPDFKRVDRGIPILATLRAEQRSSTPHIASKPERNENIKYLIYPSGNRTLNLSRLQSHACTPEPRLALTYYNKNINVISYVHSLSSRLGEITHVIRSLFR